MWLARVIALTACFIAARCVNPTDENYAHTIDYLRKYGYLTEDVDAFPAQRRNDVLRNAIEEFQRYYGLPGDGTLDEETLQLMRKPRCGFQDILKHGTAASLSKWPRTHLTWDFYVAAKEELNTARAAFDLWSQHSALTFERSETNPDIIISWRTRRHGNTNINVNSPNCSAKFDGPGNVLAHAYLPTNEAGFVSEVHVDGDEPWHIYVGKNPSNTFSLHFTLTHEIGHSLGLPHNERKTSVMFAYSPDKQYPVKLDRFDIIDIQPAAYQSPSGDLMVFVDNLVYMVQYPEFSLRPNWPKTLRELGFPADAKLNGAVNTHRGRSFVMYNGNSVGEIDECTKKVVRRTPLEATFPGIPTGVTSIFRYVDGNLYFTTRTQFYRFNEITKTVTAAGKFDLQMLNIVCPKTELLQQLRDLLDRIVRVGDLTSPASDSDNDDDDDGGGGVQLYDRRIRRRK
ncbi:neutrophil collagenase-like [Temnothorax nylanderi]|uniref:neutrophil collagenase-like n=1 Tax=Temnothorax nylanderi TaxID=102681 RepID=UPI003A890F4F